MYQTVCRPSGPTVALMGRTDATACYRELGAELKKCRDAAGRTGDDITRGTGWHRSKVSRVELGQAEISVVDTIHYLGACGIFAREEPTLLALCHDAELNLGYRISPHSELFEGTLSSLIYHESTADRSIIFDSLLVPALLQTPAYARARIATSGLDLAVIDRAVQSRMGRRQILSQPHPARFVFFVHENALRLQIGSPEVMQEQLLNLTIIAALDYVTFRVIPALAGEQSVFGAPFRLFERDTHEPFVYVDNAASGLFLDDPNYVASYRHIVSRLTTVALDEGKSRAVAASLADEFERGTWQQHARIREPEFEQSRSSSPRFGSC